MVQEVRGIAHELLEMACDSSIPIHKRHTNIEEALLRFSDQVLAEVHEALDKIDQDIQAGAG